MTLQQVAQQAMDYLDSVGLAAEYDISKPVYLTGMKLDIITDDCTLTIFGKLANTEPDVIMDKLKAKYPTKSPA